MTGVRSAAVAVLVAMLSGCGFAAQTAAQPKGPIKIAALLSLTGVYSVVGIPQQSAAQVAVDDINAHGGINGRKVELTVFDDQSKQEQGVALAQQIASDPGFLGVVGLVNATMGPPESTALNNAAVPTVAVFGDATRSTDPGKYVFKEAPTFDTYALGMMGFIQSKLKFTKVGVLYETNVYGTGILNTFKAQGSQFSIQVVDAESIQPNAVDDTAQLSRIVASGAQVIVTANSTNLSVPILNWAALGYPLPLIGQIGYSNPLQIKPSEEPGKKITAIVAQLTGDDPLPRQKAFVQLYEKARNETPQYPQAAMWDAVQMLAKGLKTDASSRETVRASIEKIKDFQGAGGVYTFSAQSHQGFDPSGIVMIRYQGNGHYSLYS